MKQKGILKLAIIPAILLALIAVPGIAQEGPSSPGLTVLDLSFGARGLALSEMMHAMPGDRFSVYNNPATSAFAEQTVVIAGFQNMGFVNNIGLIGLFKFRFGGALNLGLKAATIDGIEVRPDPNDPDYYIDNTNVVAAIPALAFSYRYEGLGMGITMRAQTVTLGQNPYGEEGSDFTATSVGFDVGGYYEIGDIGLGLVVQNLGGRMYFVEDTLENDSLESGASQPLYVGSSGRYSLLENKLHLLAGAGYGARGLVLGGAVEYLPWRVLALRLGYNTERISGGAVNGLTTGLGIRLANLEVNYSFLFNEYLGQGGMHGIDIGFHFGASESERERLLAEAREQAAREAFERQKLTSQTLYEQGISQYNMSRYDDALASWDLALIWWPDNNEAQDMIDKVSNEKEDIELTALVDQAKQAYVSKNYVALVVLTERILAQDSTHSLALFYRQEAEKGVTEELIASAPAAVQDDLRSGIEALGDEDYLTAMRSFEKVLDYDPTNTVAQDYIRKTQGEVNRYIEGEMDDVNTLLGRSRYDEAKSKVRDLLKLAPQNEELLVKLGEIDRKLSEDVQRRLKRAEETQDPVRTEKELKTALQLDPSNKQAQENLAKVEKETKVNKADVQKLYLMGVESYSEHNYELAISYWQRVLAMDPGHTNASKNLARAKAKLSALAGN